MADAADEAMAKGPKGEGPAGFRVPSAETQEKGTPADEQGAGRRGVEEGAEQPGMPLGEVTSSGMAGMASSYRQEGAKTAGQGAAQQGDLPPEVAQAKDISPDATTEPRIPETERPDESPAGLGKGVGVPPGTAGRETGQTPNN
jgi:hypothetical protein